MGILWTAALDLVGHVAQLGAETDPRRRVPTPHRADERAGLVERQRRHVRAEIVPDEILAEVLLHVRQIEGRHDRVLVLEVPADRTDRFRAAEVSR